LQTLSELGLAGATLIAGLIFYVLYTATLHYTQEGAALIDAVIISLSLSVYSINLDFLVLWILTWSSLGMSVSNLSLTAQDEHRTSLSRRAVSACAALLVLFYMFIIMAADFRRAPARAGVMVWASLLNSDDVAELIEINVGQNGALQKSWITAVIRLHADDPTVLRALSKYFLRKGEIDNALRLAERSLMSDPKNIQSLATFTKAVSASGRPLGVVEGARFLSAQYLDDAHRQQIYKGLATYPPLLPMRLAHAQLNYDAYTSAQAKELLAKLLYIFGDSMKEHSPEGVVFWWKLATAYDPGVSYYWVDLAGYYYKVGKTQEAAQVLAQCQLNTFARAHCEQAQTKLSSGDKLSMGENAKDIIQGIHLMDDESVFAPIEK
jgi:tetratricopeptide (TPR) repeat protein